MQFESTHVSGKGRGKPMGFPTINLKIPEKFKLKDGVYAVKVVIEKYVFKGALHFGPTPTFNEKEKSLEVYLIGVSEGDLVADGLTDFGDKVIHVEIIKYLRPVAKFRLVEDLRKQIEEDVAAIKSLKS